MAMSCEFTDYIKSSLNKKTVLKTMKNLNQLDGSFRFVCTQGVVYSTNNFFLFFFLNDLVVDKS